jgi:hypothetical protein
MAVWHQPGPDAFRLTMSDPKKTQQKTPAARTVAETARQEGAQGRTGKAPNDTVSDGEVDASDPAMQAEIATIADEVHANA